MRRMLLGAALVCVVVPESVAARAPTPRIVFYTEHSCPAGLGACGNGELAVVAADGSHYRLLTHNHVTERHPSWSADHRSIVYERGSPSRIWEMRADGSRQHPLRLFRRRGERLLQPTLSPDGRRLATSVWTGTTFRIFVYDLRNGARTPLPGDFAPGDSETTPDWSPDGTRLAFAGWTYDAGSQIYISSVRSGTSRQLTECDPGECASPSWSPDGRRIAYSCSGVVCITPAREVRPRVVTRTGADPNWSPDGRWLALAGSYGDIYVVRPDGTDQHRVAKRSPDQTRINLDPDW
jgi:Tol biopolymer transport system component